MHRGEFAAAHRRFQGETDDRADVAAVDPRGLQQDRFLLFRYPPLPAGGRQGGFEDLGERIAAGQGDEPVHQGGVEHPADEVQVVFDRLVRQPLGDTGVPVLREG